MASPLSHAVAALSLGTCFYHPQIPKRVWIAGAVCSMISDVDVIGFRFGIHYGDFWGHRGFTHSLVFAALLAGVVTIALFLREASEIGRLALFAYLFLATASHGALDAMTNGGLGVAFFSPFENSRYFLPWRPILVSPISLRRFFGGRGDSVFSGRWYSVFQSELVWIWLPAILFAGLVLMFTRRTKSASL